MVDRAAWPDEGLSEEDMDPIRRHTRTCRPLGSAGFLDRLEHLMGRILRPFKRGPKPKPEELR